MKPLITIAGFAGDEPVISGSSLFDALYYQGATLKDCESEIKGKPVDWQQFIDSCQQQFNTKDVVRKRYV